MVQAQNTTKLGRHPGCTELHIWTTLKYELVLEETPEKRLSKSLPRDRFTGKEHLGASVLVLVPRESCSVLPDRDDSTSSSSVKCAGMLPVSLACEPKRTQHLDCELVLELGRLISTLWGHECEVSIVHGDSICLLEHGKCRAE